MERREGVSCRFYPITPKSRIPPQSDADLPVYSGRGPRVGPQREEITKRCMVGVSFRSVSTRPVTNALCFWSVGDLVAQDDRLLHRGRRCRYVSVVAFGL